MNPSQPADLIDLTSPLPDDETSSQSGGQSSSSAPVVAGSSQGQVVQTEQKSSSDRERTPDIPDHQDVNDSDSSESSSSSDSAVIDSDTASQSSEDDRVDQSGITETAAGLFYDNQEHILDGPITEEELNAAISPVISYSEQPPRNFNTN